MLRHRFFVPTHARKGAPTRRATLMLWTLLVLHTVADAYAADPFLRRTAAVEVMEKVGPAVVNVTTRRQDPAFAPNTGRREEFFRNFLRPRQHGGNTQTLGSGVIIDRERHVLTNAHVIADSNRIRVTLADGREFPARLVGAAPNNDLAVLQIETEEALPWVPPGRSDDLMVGEPVIAIGNPFGLFSNTVTTGVLSAIDRSVTVEGDYYYGFLQTDASINPGNSGGPLLNAEGTLIGINTAIYRGGQGIGLAIPIDAARRVVAELLEHGEIPPPWIGLEFKSLDPGLQTVVQLPDRMSGALVTHVESNSPAERAGMKRGDIVLAIDGHRIERDRSFFEALKTSLVGQKIALQLWREGEILKDQLIAKAKAVQAIEGTYVKIIQTGAGEYGLAALVDLGQLYENLADTLRTSYLPPSLTADQAELYRMGLEDKAYPNEEKAVEAYTQALTKSYELNLYNDNTAFAVRRLGVLRPADFPGLEEDLVTPRFTAKSVVESTFETNL